MKTFTSAGVSKDTNGRLALRASNREEGVYPEILKKEGHTDIHIIKLKTPMGKDEIRKYLKGLKAFQTPEILKCLTQDDEAKETAAAKAKVSKPTQAKAPKKGGSKGGGKKSTKKAQAETENDGEVANTETTGDDGVDLHQEHDLPPAAKHFAE